MSPPRLENRASPRDCFSKELELFRLAWHFLLAIFRSAFAPTFKMALWRQADGRLKAGATRNEMGESFLGRK
jgi:hypothetical protein